jgi:hypothetical protein
MRKTMDAIWQIFLKIWITWILWIVWQELRGAACNCIGNDARQSIENLWRCHTFWY